MEKEKTIRWFDNKFEKTFELVEENLKQLDEELIATVKTIVSIRQEYEALNKKNVSATLEQRSQLIDCLMAKLKYTQKAVEQFQIERLSIPQFQPEFSEAIVDNSQSDDRRLHSMMMNQHVPKPDLNQYGSNDRGHCFIVSLIDNTDFYISDVKNMNKMLFPEELTDEWSPLMDEPKENEIFALLTDKMMCRALKINSKEALLIDLCDIVPINSDSKMFSLSLSIQRKPSLAIPCTLSASQSSKCPLTLYSMKQYTVIAVEKSKLVIELSECDISTKLSEDETKNTTNNSISNPHDLDEWLLEDFSTDNPMMAIQNYIPKNDHKLCRFMRADKTCFKQSLCKAIHEPVIAEGWTRDKEIVKTRIKLELIYPNVGESVHVYVTHIENVETFYAIVVQLDHIESHMLMLTNFMNDINAVDNVDQFRPMRSLCELQLVLALYDDSKWYRAQVMDIYDKNIAKIFYVDYGNSNVVPIGALRQWEAKFETIPFQAVKCRLDNVSKIKEDDVYAIEVFKKLALDKSMVADVNSNIGDLHVLLNDCSGYDIGQELINAKCARFKECVPKLSPSELERILQIE